MENFLIYGGALLAIAGAIYGYLRFTALLKTAQPTRIVFFEVLAGLLGLTLGLGGLFWGLLYGNTALTAGTLFSGTFGAMLSIFLFVGMVLCFILHYYKKEASPELRSWSFRLLWMAILPLILSFVLMMEGYDALIDFPLPEGFGSDPENPVVAFYALFILTGAAIVYFVSDHQLHQEGYRKGILENVFYIAFPAGIVGARLWYVIGQWESEFAGRPFWDVFNIRGGGLTILGGALFGTIVGVIYVRRKVKELSLLHAMDVIVPAILIAQGVGRWGNFTNAEVYGGITDPAQWWFLPNFIIQQMTVSGEMRVPLFLIESIANIGGYFLIRYAVGVGAKKFIVKGDLAALYPIWYGITRVIMEPLRDSQYIMDDWWSMYGSYGYIVIGVLAIVYLHVTDYLKKKKAKDTLNAQGSSQK